MRKLKSKTSLLKCALIFLIIAVFCVGVQAQEANSSECVRAIPEPIIKKRIFPRTNFRLEQNKSAPFEKTGFETVKFSNGDKLTVKNYGCENYSLTFIYETKRFSRKSNDTRFWYKTAIELIRQTIKGILEPNLIVRGTKALNTYIKNNKKLVFGKEIDFGGREIRDVVSISKVKKQGAKTYKVEISFGVGPL